MSRLARGTRAATCRILESVEDGTLDAGAVLKSCLSYMSEADVADMAHREELFTCSECGGIVDADADLCAECEPDNPEPDDDEDGLDYGLCDCGRPANPSGRCDECSDEDGDA